jgi:cysteine desulfurase
MTKIYLDYAASAPVRPEIKKATIPFLEGNFGNPSSIHSFGRIARQFVDKSRENVAKFFNCEPNEIIFTSGGTESDNLAIRGIIEQSTINNQQSAKKPHIITSKIEHHAVLHTCQILEKEKKAEVTYLNVDKNGQINLDDLKKSFKPHTVLVSIMYANNETGTIEPIREIGKIIEKENKNRANQIYFHSDAVQAAPYLNCDYKYLHIDMISISGHKLGALKGTGALFVKKGIHLKPQITGGEHEYKKRAGTENVMGIVALGEAVKLANDEKENKRIKTLRDYLEKEIIKSITDVEINGDVINRLPNITNINFKYVEGESILLNLDFKGIAASSGSACTSGSLSPSHVIMAMHKDPLRAHGSIRFSLGFNTTKKEIDYVLRVLPGIIKKLRKISPFGKGK